MLLVAMSIATLTKKGKDMLASVPIHVLYVSVLLGTAILAFSLGILAGKDLERGALELQMTTFPMEKSASARSAPEASVSKVTQEKAVVPKEGGGYVASKSGTRYYLPWCSGVSRIKEENKIWFATKEEAEARGLTPAKNCEGM
jgi:hypothetical protein